MQKTPSIPTSTTTAAVAGETEPPNAAATTTISSSSLLHFVSLKNPLKTMQITPSPSGGSGPIKVHPPPSPPTSSTAAVVVAGETEPPNATTATTTVAELVAENAVIVFGQRGCCMCHVVKLLLLGLGVNPTISTVEEGDVGGVIGELLKISAVDGGGGEVTELPVVYVGGKLFGGLERVVATHITGELVPMLKEANALWL